MNDRVDSRVEAGDEAARAATRSAAGDEPARAADEPGAARDDTTPPASNVMAELEDQLLRALADLDNLRKRYDRELVRERGAERARAAREWLPVVDNLELALQHADADTAALVQGLHAVHDQAVSVLTRLGFPRFEDVGEVFDPARHEALAAVEADAPERTVVATVRPGYGTSDEVLRPAGVVVARSPD